jgi:transcriptional regulator with XRE-family HTH domain
MAIGKRIKKLRTELRITQNKMADRIGIKQGSLSDIERERVQATDRVIKAISREYRINENWLRTGEGEMLDEASVSFEEFVMSMIADLDELDKKIITEYIKLSPAQKKSIKALIKNMVEE